LSLNRFVTTLKTEPPKTSSSVYLIRSYDHEERTLSDPQRKPTRASTRRTTRTDTGSNDNAARGQGRERHRRAINYGKAQKFQIWEVARAATAAPLYFEPLKIEIPGMRTHLLFTDGDFTYVNNPTMEGIREIEDLYGSNSIGVVVSIGTARATTPNPTRGLIRKIKHISSSATDPEVIHRDVVQKSAPGDFSHFSYYRLNEPDGLRIDLDEWKPREKLFANKNSG